MTWVVGREELLSCDVELPSSPGVVRCCRVGCGPDVAPRSVRLMQLLDPSTDAPGEIRHVIIRQREDTAVPGEGGELLLLVGNAWWQRRNVPVDVPVTRLAAQAHDVEPLGGQLLPDRFSHPVDQALQGEILLELEVGGDLLAVRSGSDQGVPEQRVVRGEERNGLVVGPHKVTWGSRDCRRAPGRRSTVLGGTASHRRRGRSAGGVVGLLDSLWVCPP